MARFNSRWVAAVFYGAVGAVAAWYARSVLSAGRFRDYLNGHGHVVTSDREPFWYWVWITLFLGIALYCLVRALRALSEIIQVRSMDRSLEERERLRGEAGARPGTEVVNLGKSVTVKIVGEDGQEREYHSMDEVPPEIRSQLEALEAEMMKEKGEVVSVTETSRGGIKITSRTTRTKDVSVYKIVDESGVERTYHSLEEMPPELRAAVEQAEKNLITPNKAEAPGS
jgi:membrane peptidoglycan carboxypeptidase